MSEWADEMAIERAKRMVEAFLLSVPKWREIGGECPSGGQGLCDWACEELLRWMHENGFTGGEMLWMDLAPNNDLEVVPHADYPVVTEYSGEHAVVCWADIVIDLTPRQFDSDLPFPFIWSVE